MQKKAQAGPIAFIVLILVVVVVLFVIGGDITFFWQNASETAGLTGIEAFVYDNPLLIMFIGLILGIIGWMWFGGG